MARAVIYARVSSAGDRQDTSRQVADLTEYVTYQKWELVEVFEEHVSGAKTNKDRPVLTKAVSYCIANDVSILLVSELSRLGRNAFEVLACVKELMDAGINLYLQKEQFMLLDPVTGLPATFAPVLIATLSTCAQLERENITYRLQSGRRRAIENGVKLGRKKGSVKSEEQKRAEYADMISYLKKGYSLRDIARLTGKGISTVQRIKTMINKQSIIQ